MDLLAGVALLAVLAAILFVFTHDVPEAPRAGEPLPFRLGSVAPMARDTSSWIDVPVAASTAELPGDVAAPVAAGLQAARGRLDACLGVARRRAPSGGPAPAPASRAPTELVLRLATRSRALHVEEVEVTSPGGSPALLHCARRMLDGDVIPADGAVPGRRYRLAVRLVE